MSKRARGHQHQDGGARRRAVLDPVLAPRRSQHRISLAQLPFLGADARVHRSLQDRIDLVAAGVRVRLLRLARFQAVDVEKEALGLEEIDLLHLPGFEPALRQRGHFHGRGSSGAIPAASNSAMSCAYSGLPVVSSLSPKNTLFAPAIM